MAVISKKVQIYQSQRSTYVDSRFPGTNVFANSAGWSDVCTGFSSVSRNSDPNWRVKVAKKQNASLPYKRVDIEGFPVRLTCETENFGAPWKITGSNAMRYLGDTLTSFPSVDPSVADIALSRLKRKIASHQGDLNAIIPIVELRDLHHTIKGTADLVNGLLNTLITIRKTRGRSAFKYASQAWLTHSFGINPLLADAKAACEALTNFLLRQDHTATLSGEYGTTWVTSSKNSGITGAIGANVRCTSSVEHSLSYRYAGAFNFLLKSSNDYGAAGYFHAELPALLPTAWELTAFSWVADYFTTFGDFLEDEFTFIPVASLYLNSTRKYEARGTNNLEHVPSAGYIIKSQTTGRATWRYSEFERNVLASLPHRIVRVKTLDEIGGKYALNKVLNLASILIGRK